MTRFLWRELAVFFVLALAVLVVLVALAGPTSSAPPRNVTPLTVQPAVPFTSEGN